MFREGSEKMYATWRPGRLFGLYISLMLNIQERGELHPNDMGELEKVTLALNDKPLPEKVRFYNALGDPAHREMYKKTFLEVGLDN